MKLKEIAEADYLEKVYIANADEEIKSGYSCDLLSEVMGRAEADSIWITVHTNMNVIAVASMIDIKAVIISEGHDLCEEFINKAKEEGISLFKSKKNSYFIAGNLYKLGVE